MRKFFTLRSDKVGMSPGTLVHVGERKLQQSKISVWEYDADRLHVFEPEKVTDFLPLEGREGVSWVNVDGIHDVDLIGEIGQGIGIHPLVLEDILNTTQRPKLEDFGDYLYLVLKMVYWNEDENLAHVEQVSLILGKSYVITFQEGDRDVFDPVRKRIREKRGRIGKLGPDFLAYTLLDAIVDHYFVVLEKIGEQIEELEEELVAEPSTRTLQTIHQIKRELIFLRRSVWPLREVLGSLQRGEAELFSESTVVYLRDVYDHTIQVIDTVETFRDLVGGMLDIYLSSVSNKMNEVMKVLTIIATIFIPLTFVAGIYGMNFGYMPELTWRGGYFAVLGLMLVIALLMVIYFRRKRWL